MSVVARVLVCVVSSCIVVVGTVMASASAVDVVVEHDRYVGSHAIITSAAVDEASRRDLSSCDGCAWRFAAPCQADSGGNTCTSVIRGCPAGRELLRFWFAPRGRPWEDRGLVCLLGSEIVPVTRLGSDVRDRFERRVPRQNPSCEPESGAVTQLPLVCQSGQPGPAPVWDESLLGVDVRVQSIPVWRWDFDPGARLETTSPGGAYPDMSVTHTYRTSGVRLIRVTTEWRGSYTADGLGPFPLPAIRQVAEIPVIIGQARAVLTRPTCTDPGWQTEGCPAGRMA
ncbi:MAG: hypothetical protein FJW97_01970 [Actinobacteria bacterium]|nr:hypothetical protein [Actinomycetota bacterium]